MLNLSGVIAMLRTATLVGSTCRRWRPSVMAGGMSTRLM